MLNLSDKKVLIFSDCHLTCKFDKEWFNVVKKIIDEHDLVIINGDFWEYKSCELKKFLNSKWKNKLFPILKKKTIIIFGNHDIKKDFYKYVHQFSFESKENLEFISGNKKFILEHGHKILHKKPNRKSLFIPLIKILKKWKKFYLFLRSLEESENPLFYPFVKFIHNCNLNRKEQLEKEVIKKIKEKKKNKEWDDNTIFIFGHIHKPKHNLKNNYLILGAFKNKKKRYISIKNGKIDFINEDLLSKK